MPTAIVAAIDRSPAAAQAVRLLIGYQGEHASLSVLLLNVQPLPWGDLRLEAHLHLLEEALQAEGHAQLEEARLLLTRAGFAVETSVQLGMPSEQIIAAAASRDAATIVVGTRGHGMLRGFALGSVALRVVHGARSPVLLVQPDTWLPPGFGRSVRVLVALDGSAQATRAVPALLAREPWLGRLEFELVHVRRAVGLRGRLAPEEQAMLDQWGSLEAEEATRDARALLYAAGHPSRLHEPTGDAASEVVRLAEELRADFVVMGTRGLGALHHALIGSVALKVAIASPIAVMLVP
ncbi:MAG TPA: universal stress protein [Burkholderiales bacterium]|nr:universal stress protein [Burkholderiales bacterium]